MQLLFVPWLLSTDSLTTGCITVWHSSSTNYHCGLQMTLVWLPMPRSDKANLPWEFTLYLLPSTEMLRKQYPLLLFKYSTRSFRVLSNSMITSNAVPAHKIALKLSISLISPGSIANGVLGSEITSALSLFSLLSPITSRCWTYVSCTIAISLFSVLIAMMRVTLVWVSIRKSRMNCSASSGLLSLIWDSYGSGS